MLTDFPKTFYTRQPKELNTLNNEIENDNKTLSDKLKTTNGKPYFTEV